jgi:acetyl esterase/lipase
VAALDLYAKRFLDTIAAAGAPDIAQLTPQQMRDGFRRLAQSVDIKHAPIGAIEDRHLPGPGGPLAIRAYTPQKAATEPKPGIVFFHGGGCVFGSLDTHEGFCRMLANESGCKLISVGYRQAPEHKFPAAVEDSHAATIWVVEHARDFGLDPQRIAIGGDSAGAGLAAVVCQMAARDGGPRLALQVLFCPVMDMKGETASRRAFAEGYFLNQATFDWMIKQYCAPGTDLTDTRLSPLRATDFRGLPPAHIHTADFDPLRDEGWSYAEKLRGAGVAVEYTCHEGMIHHFYGMAGAIPYARLAVKNAGAAIRDALA